MKNLYMLCNLIFFLLCSCRTENDTSHIIIPVDVENNSKDISFYDVFKSADLIYLETSEDCLIGEVNKISYADNIYYIFDRRQAGVFAFSKKGKFLFKIQNIGSGPGEYFRIADFEINKYTNSIDLLTPFGEVLKYDREHGKFISSYHLPETIRAVHFLKSISQDTTVFYQRFENNPVVFFSLKEQIIISEQRELPQFISRYLPTAFNWHPFHIINGKLRLFEFFSNTIHNLEHDELTPHLIWDFGEYNFDYKTLDVGMDRQYYEDYLKNNSKIHLFSTFLENELLIITQFFLKTNFYTLIYFKESEEYIVLGNFKEGIMFPTYPLFDDFGLYTVASLLHLKDLLPDEKIDSLGLKFSEDIGKDQNPVILRYSFK